MARADAYVALYPFLSKATLPRGVGDLAKDLPPADVTLFASKASLVVRKDFHAAIQYLLLSTAVQIHSGVGHVPSRRAFPGSRRHRTATEQRGRSVLQIRAAVPAAQSSVLDGVAGRTPARPAHPDRRRAVPDDAVSAALYGWLMRRKIARLYGELRFLEDEITGGGGPTDAAQLMARLHQLEKQANQLRMPIAYESMMYLLRNHIGVVRNRLAAGQP